MAQDNLMNKKIKLTPKNESTLCCINSESRESSVNMFMGFEESHLRRRENKNFNFERNKAEEVEEELLMKKEKISVVPSFIVGKPIQPISSPSFSDPLSSDPLNKKLNSQIK